MASRDFEDEFNTDKDLFPPLLDEDPTDIDIKKKHGTNATVSYLSKKLLIIPILAIVLAVAYKYYSYQATELTRNQMLNGTVIFGSQAPPTIANYIIDCHPEKNADYNTCIKRGCQWNPNVPSGAPWCVFPSDASSPTFPGYDFSLLGGYKAPNGILVRRDTPSLFGGDYGMLYIEVDAITDTHLKITIAPQPSGRETRKLSDSNEYSYVANNAPFGFAVVRKSTGRAVFDTRNIPGFTFAKQFIQLATVTPSDLVYGFGEQQHTNLRRDMNWSKFALFARDRAPDGNLENLYGTHPFYLGLEPDGNSYGIFLNTSFPLQVALQPDPSLINYRVIGGALDLHVYLGPRPDAVIEEYVSTVGRPAMPPLWGLGFQLSRYGYPSLAAAEAVYNRNMAAKIPIETMYFDIDFMYKYMDFTIGKNFEGLNNFAQTLHNASQKLVVMVDAAIASQPDITYDALSLGLKYGVFVRDGQNSSLPFEGKVWPNLTYYPDFTHPKAVDYWTQLHQSFYELLQFDGIWNDMNEPSNFLPGSYRISPQGGCAQNSINYPPFNPLTDSDDLFVKTLCPDAIHYAGNHYEYHNLYGHDEIRTTYAALHNLFPQNRPFILTRSSHSGSGQFAAKWTGDVFSTWPQLTWSIIGMLDFNMFGMPFVGADICGFNGNTTRELCVRWHQVGAFYPFSRNHNSIGCIDQDPAAWDNASIDAIRSVLDIRSTFIPVLYTLLAQSHANGTPTARPLFFQWPEEAKTWNMDSQFLWGDSLMFAPILEEGAVSRDVFFPEGTWFQYPTGTKISDTTNGESKTIKMAYNETGIFILDNQVLPIQRPGMNTDERRRNSMGLIIALSEEGSAEGEMYWDDGETPDARNLGLFAMIKFKVEKKENRLRLVFSANSPNPQSWSVIGSLTFDHLWIYGCNTSWFSCVAATKIEEGSQRYTVETPTRGVAKVDLTNVVTIDGNRNISVEF